MDAGGSSCNLGPVSCDPIYICSLTGRKLAEELKAPEKKLCSEKGLRFLNVELRNWRFVENTESEIRVLYAPSRKRVLKSFACTRTHLHSMYNSWVGSLVECKHSSLITHILYLTY